MSDAACVQCGRPAAVWRELTGPDGEPKRVAVCENCASLVDGTFQMGRPAANAFWKTGAMGGGLFIVMLLAMGFMVVAGVMIVFSWLGDHWH